MTQASSAPGGQFRGRLARRLVATLLPLTILPLFLLGALSFSRARQILIDQISDTLTRLEERQTEEINRWLANRRERFNFFYISPEAENAIRIALLTEGDHNAEGFEQARQTVLETLENVNSGGKLFHQFLLVDRQGTVVVASNPNLEGTSLADQPYFETLEGRNAALAVYAPAPITNALAVIISRPYLGPDGIPRATFWGVSGLSLFEDILFGSETVGARHYVVTNDGHYVSFGANTKAIVHGPLIEPSPQQIALFGQALEDTPQPIVQYTSFDNQTVLGTYTLVPDLQMGLVTEIPIQPILNRLNNLPYFSLVLLGSVLLAAALVWIGSQRITRPILEVAQAAQHFAEGDWLKRAVVNRNDEIGLLAHSFNNMADEISRLYRSLEIQVEERTQQILTAAEVARAAIVAQDLNELLQRTVQLIVERFGFYYAAIFLVDELRENVILRDSYSAAVRGPIEREFSSLPIGPGSLVGLVASTNRPHVADDVEQDPDYLKVKELPDTRSEAVLPLSLGDEVLGVLDVQSSQPRAFPPETLATLQTLANQITAALRNFRLLEASQVNLQLTTALYDISHQIAEAETQEEVYERLADALKQSPYITAVFRLEENRMTALAMNAPGQTPPRTLPSIALSRTQISAHLPEDRPLIILEDADASGLPKPLIDMPRRLGCQAFSLFPIAPEGKLEALLILGATDRGAFSRANLDP
ncbi:MAG: HAMP domain-containing protein, partial [Anaerolineae bacterium]